MGVGRLEPGQAVPAVAAPAVAPERALEHHRGGRQQEGEILGLAHAEPDARDPDLGRVVDGAARVAVRAEVVALDDADDEWFTLLGRDEAADAAVVLDRLVLDPDGGPG